MENLLILRVFILQITKITWSVLDLAGAVLLFVAAHKNMGSIL